MNPSREANSPTPSSVSPDRLRVPWYGFGLLIFDQGPFARSWLPRYLLAILIGYPLSIDSSTSLIHAPWLSGCLEVWRPLVELLTGIFPTFDNYQSLLLAKGYDHSVGATHHLLALGWLASFPMLIFLFLT